MHSWSHRAARVTANKEEEFFSGQEIFVRDFCDWSGEFRKDLKSQKKIWNVELRGHGRAETILILLKRKG